MKKNPRTKEQLLAENEHLRRRLEEAEETLRAIHEGEVDALVLSKPQGEVVYTLEGAEHPYRVFVEAMSEGAATLDPDGTILYCNNRFAEMLKIPSDKVIGSSIYRFIPPTDRSDFESAFQVRKQEDTTVDISLKREDQEPMPVHLSFNMLHGQEMPVVCIVAMDLTEHKHMEEALRQFNVQLEKRVQDRTAELVKVNERLRAEIVERQSAQEELQRSRNELELRVLGRTRELKSINEDLEAENEERLKVEIELRESESLLRELSSGLLNAHEKERRLVAQEIHDSIGSSLAATKWKVQAAFEEVGENNPQIRSALEAILRMLQETIQETRRIQMDLRPPMLDDLGILATIRWFCQQYESTYSPIRIRQKIDIKEEEVDDSLKTVIFRVLQEALNNSAKHSKASEVLLHISRIDRAIQLFIGDNGQGFDPSETHSRTGRTRGLGLVGMRERVNLSGGSFAIESSLGKGTVIRASWPASPQYS
jgi:PAS domain S-box-containing protein